MNTPKHIALIGCGFTGTSAFYQLVDKYPVSEITIFEASGEYGPGLPYRGDECDDYLLNNTNDTLCLEPNNRHAFLNWLNSDPDLPAGVEMPEINPRGNLPRTFYGYFLKDVIKSTRINAAIKDIKVNLIAAEVTEIIEKDNQVTIKWNSGEVTADNVILTTGHCPQIDRYENPPDGSNALYFPDHVNEPSLDIIPMDATCYILGASLSAYDVVGRLFSEKTGSRFKRDQDGILSYIAGPNERNVILCSRSGRLKKMKSRTQKDINRQYFTLDYLTSKAADGALRLEDIADAIKKDCENNDGDLNWDEVIAPYKDCLNAKDVDDRAADILEKDVRTAIEGTARNILVDIFGDAGLEIWDMFAARLVSPEEENRYRSQFETATLTYEAACPISTAEKLLALHCAGKLKIIKGVERVSFDQNKDAYLIEHEFGSEHATVLLNTTGSVERDISSTHQPKLIQNMVKSGMMKSYICGGTKMPGVDVDIETFRINGTKNIHLASQLLWGPGFYTSGAIYMATFVDRILKSLFNK
tara:strand:+ start:20231 stop:21817 length:1587 start_codon:yes stop_codon:yes gene_type:complete